MSKHFVALILQASPKIAPLLHDLLVGRSVEEVVMRIPDAEVTLG